MEVRYYIDDWITINEPETKYQDTQKEIIDLIKRIKEAHGAEPEVIIIEQGNEMYWYNRAFKGMLNRYRYGIKCTKDDKEAEERFIEKAREYDQADIEYIAIANKIGSD